MSKILLFIPCYNCEKQIKRVLKSLTPKVCQHFSEILVVDNISPDNTIKVVSDFMKQNKKLPITLIQNKENYNLGGSHKTALNYALSKGYDYLAVLHGDDQADINDLIPILEEGTYQKYDACLGSRFMRKSRRQGYSKVRLLANYIFNLIYSVCLMHPIYDMGSGLNIYSVQTLKWLKEYFENLSDSLTFNDESLVLFKFFKKKMYFFPISWKEEDQKSNLKAIKTFFRVIMIPVCYFLMRGKYVKQDHRLNQIKTYEYKLIVSNL